MASRYHALQNLMAQQQKERTDLLAAIDSAHTALVGAATPEEKAAQQTKLDDLTAKASALSADIEATATEFEAIRRLHEAERKADGVVTREAAQVTPLVEQDPRRGYSSIGEFALDARAMDPRSGRFNVSERLAAVLNESGFPGARVGAAAPSQLHQEGHSSDGLLVPPDFRREIWRPVFENDDLLALVDPMPTSSNAVQYVKDESTPWGSVGIKAYWVAEGAQKTGSRLGHKGAVVTLDKCAALVFATDESLQDSALLTSRINESAPQAIAWTVSEAIVRGSGAGQPLGWENSPALITVSKKSGQAAATIVAENVLDMYSRLLVGPGSRVAWLANRDTVPQIGTLKIGNEPSWVAQNKGLQEAPTGLMLGDPLRFTEHAETLGTAGDIQLVNFAGYAAFIHSGGTRYDASIHLYFDYDITAFRWVMRVGGQPYLSAPTAAHKGSATKSHFIYLQTRP